MRLSYRKKLFFYFLIVFAVFAAIVVFVQQNRERTFRNDEFKRGMDVYATLISKYIAENHLTAPDSMSRLDSLLPLLPRDLRISIIDRRGNVLFDNGSDGKPIVENHLSRPEIAQALIRGGGSHIRHSATTGKTYYYYARLFGNDFVRVALPYDNAAKLSLKADDFFLYFMLLLFFVALISLLYLSDRFGKAVSGLRDFLVSTENNRPDFDKVRFPDTELGEIGNRIVTNYRLLRESRNLLDTEREKLIRHFHYSDEGICIFSPDGDKIYANSHFIQHLNTILDKPTSDATAILRAKDFGDLREFLQRHRPVNPQSASIPIYETKLTREGRHFAVRLLIFNDNSFEITLDNITAQEKNRLLKQEMTNNIAHELKTPVTSIRGYLETLLQQHEISPDKQRFFLDRAYTQALRLSDLIRDVALITKIEEATDLFERKPVDLKQVVEEVIADHKNTLDAHRVQIVDRISRGTTVEGNHTLLYSIFWNLTDNAVNYAGEGVTITIEQYAEDDDFYYFSFHDNGCGVPEADLEKIFVRFYRVDEGRSRKNGGSGLGLSIVRNSVLYHKGRISAKNRKEGGLEFLFSLAKKS